MEKEKIKTVSLIVAVSAAIICGVSILFSYRVYVSSRELITEYRAELSAIRQSCAELEKKFTAQKFFENKSVENDTGPGLLKKSPLPSESEEGFTADQRQKIKELEQIVQSTGLDQLAANENLDPAILSKIYEEYALQDMLSSYREKAMARNLELHQLDQKQYNEELMSLYDRARLRRRGAGNAEDQEKAFSEMLSKFPDAYATGMAIAERGLRSAFLRNSSDVETYYSMLRENDKFTDIITDRGMEAMPNLENYLAYNYIREGRLEEAEEFIESLERNYANSFVITRGADRRFKWIPASQASENLRLLLE